MAGTFSFPWRFVMILGIGALLLLAGAVCFKAPTKTRAALTVNEFQKLLQEKQIVVDSDHTLDVDKEENNRIDHVRGWYHKQSGELDPFETYVPPEQDVQVLGALLNSGLKFDVTTVHPILPPAAARFLPYLIFGFVILRLVFRLRRASRARG